MSTITLTFDLDDPRLTPVLAVLLGVLGASSTAIRPPRQDGSYMNPQGLAVIDDLGATVIANPKNISEKTLAALRLLASKPNLSEAELVVDKAAITKRVQAAIGRKGARLYRIENGKVIMADETRRSLARHFGFEK